MNETVQISRTSALDAAATHGISVPSGGNGNDYGSAVQLIASTDYDAAGFLLHGYAAMSDNNLIKICVGGAGSEQDIVEVPCPSDFETIFCPVPIPAGSRVSAKSAGGYNTPHYVAISLIRGRSFDPLVARGVLATPGAGTSSLGYVDVDAGATANTKGAWVQLVASTPRDARGYTLVILADQSNDANGRIAFDLAVGAAASEQVILADVLGIWNNYNPVMRPQSVGPIWTPIPAGSRIACRVQCTLNTAQNRVHRFGLTLWE